MTMSMSSTPLPAPRPAFASLDTQVVGPGPLPDADPPLTDGPPLEPIPIQIVIPSALVAFTEQQVAKWGFADAADYVEELILNHQDHMELRARILEGLRSGPPRFVDAEYLAELDALVNQHDPFGDGGRAGGMNV